MNTNEIKEKNIAFIVGQNQTFKKEKEDFQKEKRKNRIYQKKNKWKKHVKIFPKGKKKMNTNE